MYTFLDSLDDGGVDSLQDIKDTQYYVWYNYSTWLEARETRRFKINCKKKHGQFYVFYPSFTTSVTCGSWRDMQIRWPGSQDQLQPSLLHDFEQALSLLGSNSSLEFLWTLWSNVFAVQLNSDVELWCISHRNTGVSEKMRQGRGEKSCRNGMEVASIFRHLLFQLSAPSQHPCIFQSSCPQLHFDVSRNADLSKNMVWYEERGSFFNL